MTIEGKEIMPDSFKQLAIHLDHLPGGFPETETGVELRILRRLFSEQEAQIAIALTLIPEPVETIAARLKRPSQELKKTLDEMASKGLIFKLEKKETMYMAAQFVIGIWEFHVNDLDPELIRDFNAYVPHLAKQWAHQKTNQFRVIPISKSLSAQVEIMPYEAAEELIQSQSKIVVAPCICRKEHRMAGKGCDYPLEVCLVFGSSAAYYENNGLGRPVDTKEALSILEKGIDAGLVLQAGNAQKAMNICMCCGCCCQVLKNMKTMPSPAKIVRSNYYAVVDEDMCVDCGACIERCHMEAISADIDVQIDLDRCIGCGVCIPACENQALSLAARTGDDRHPTPRTTFDTYFKIAQERGLI
jgi:NAD-dependent dihydropyrimidine dehydrogenase PreA subunit